MQPNIEKILSVLTPNKRLIHNQWVNKTGGRCAAGELLHAAGWTDMQIAMASYDTRRLGLHAHYDLSSHHVGKLIAANDNLFWTKEPIMRVRALVQSWVPKIAALPHAAEQEPRHEAPDDAAAWVDAPCDTTALVGV